MRFKTPLLAFASAGLAVTAVPAFGAGAAVAPHHHRIAPTVYSVGTPRVAGVQNGPWTLAQSGAQNPGSGPTSGFTGTGGPLPGYCGAGGANPESGPRTVQPAGTLPMQPYYFPFVTQSTNGKVLTGYFDYRPKDSDEAVAAATSTNGGKTWTFKSMALQLNKGLCPNGNSVDDGQGHAFVMQVPAGGTKKHPRSKTLLYTLSRPAGDNPGVNLIIHTLHPTANNPLAGLPASEPVGLGGSTTATNSSPISVPAGPGPAGGGGVTLTVASTANFEAAGQINIGGSVVNCVDANMTATTMDGCTTTNPSGITVTSGEAVTAPSIIPAGAQQTDGLVSPDGIVSQVPQHLLGAPAGSISILYTEKIVNYFTPTSTTAAVVLPAATIPVGSTSGLPLSNGSIRVALGTTGGIQLVTCTGEDATDLTGCTGGSGSVAKGNQVGAPGAAIAPYSTLSLIGEGKNKPKSLFGNNEDYTVMRGAWTKDGVHFHDLGVTSGLNTPTTNAPGVLRWVGSRGTVVRNPDGTLGLFQSGADVNQGDSDAFGEIFYSSSKDGMHWTTPKAVLTTDDTFSALSANAANPNAPLGITGYYSGRVYDPTVVVNKDHSLTMIFAGYSTPKPLPAVGSVYGTDPSSQYTVPAGSPARYRTILSVKLTPSN